MKNSKKIRVITLVASSLVTGVSFSAPSDLSISIEKYNETEEIKAGYKKKQQLPEKPRKQKEFEKLERLEKPGKLEKPERLGKPGMLSGLIKANRHIVNLNRCDGEALAVKIKIPHKVKSFWSHKADAHLVAAFPSDDESGQSKFISWNLRDVIVSGAELSDGKEKDHPIFKLSCDALQSVPTGPYQFSIILTVTDGDPTNLADWHRGFNGLLATSKVKINRGFDESDLDEDGEVDGDTDFDGIVDKKIDIGDVAEGKMFDRI